jgi:hypothetical protein
MNPKQTIPLLAKLSPALIAAGPPVLIGAAIGMGLLWLLFGDKKEAEQETLPPVPDVPPPITATAPAPAPLSDSPARAKRVRREDLAEALAYGARSMTRGEAVAALQNLGFGKTAAYKALSEQGRFVEFLHHTSDGLIEWKG